MRLVIAGASLSVLSFPTSPLALRETVDLMSNQLSATPRAIEAAKFLAERTPADAEKLSGPLNSKFGQVAAGQISKLAEGMRALGSEVA